MKKLWTPAERLVVAADFTPNTSQGRKWVRDQVLWLADLLSGIPGLILKVGAAQRALDYGLIDEIHERGLRVFVDLKIIDILNTLRTDGVLLRQARPEFVTAMCVAGVLPLRALKAELPDTEVLGVTVPTSFTDADTMMLYNCYVMQAVIRLARVAQEAQLDGLVCAPRELRELQAKFGDVLSLNTANIRPSWAKVIGDDQNPDRAMTAEEAIRAGTWTTIVGRPITQAKKPYDATMRIIAEIAEAMGQSS